MIGVPKRERCYRNRARGPFLNRKHRCSPLRTAPDHPLPVPPPSPLDPPVIAFTNRHVRAKQLRGSLEWPRVSHRDVSRDDKRAAKQTTYSSFIFESMLRLGGICIRGSPSYPTLSTGKQRETLRKRSLAWKACVALSAERELSSNGLRNLRSCAV